MDTTTAEVMKREAERQAAAGHREAALELLERLRSPTPDVATIILRAKILSQQGKFPSATDAWREAIAAEPTSDEAKRGLALAEALAHSSAGRLRLHIRHLGVALVAAAGLVALAWTALLGLSSSRHELAQSLSRIERQHAAELRIVIDRNDGSTKNLRALIEANQSQLRMLLTEQASTNGRSRAQMRRLERRTTDLIEAIKRVEKFDSQYAAKGAS